MSTPPEEPIAPVDEQPPADVSRRTLLDLALMATAAGVGAVLAVPAIRFAMPPTESGIGATRIVAGARDEFPESTSRLVSLDGEPILVVALPGGDIRAFGARCTHLNCLVEYRATSQRIECPCHGGRYGLDGRVLAGPPPSPLREYPIEIRAGQVYVVRT